jgi:hypothetical protein
VLDEMASRRPSPADVEVTCPIPNTHRRLLSAHRLWHQALAQYDSPDGFRTNLNALIQELRNVTWVLQKEHVRVPDFERWYAEQRQRLRADRLSRWVVDARNRIVKQGDLATSSKARVSVLMGYDRPAAHEFDAPPLDKTRAIAAGYAATAPPLLRRDGVLIVERRWVAQDLPDEELLTALAKVFGVLSNVVAEAHQKAGGQFIALVCRKFTNHERSRTGVPPCMIAGEQRRRVVVKLQSGATVERRERTISIPNAQRQWEALREQFGKDLPDPTTVPRDDLMAMGRYLHEMGRFALVRDGYHLQFVQLTRGKELVAIKVVTPEDQADKHLLWHSIAEEVAREGVDGVISTGEMWQAPYDPAFPERAASESPERREILQTSVASAKGIRAAIVTPFERGVDGAIVLKTTYENRHALLFMEPVFQVWRGSDP